MSFEGIRLCRGTFCVATEPEVATVALLCQSVVLDGVAYAWIDGVNKDNPVLVPIEDLLDFSWVGTLGSYLRDERHVTLGARFDDLLDMTLQRGLSATAVARMCEFMHAEGMDASEACAAVEEWGDLLCEMDWSDRAIAHYAMQRESAALDLVV